MKVFLGLEGAQEIGSVVDFISNWEQSEKATQKQE
jgi:hypothetical protein